MITVACVNWGDKFSDAYIQNLKSMVERHTTIEHEFVCLSDRDIPGVKTKKLMKGYEGWWNKLQLFHAGNGFEKRVVYLDLDTLVVGNIDWLLEYRGVFMGIEDVGCVNANQPHLKGVMQSGVMAWDYNVNHKVWDGFIQNPDAVRKFRGDGEFLQFLIPEYARDLLQRVYPNRLKSYKYQVYKEGITNDLSLICFHGRPSIVQAMYETIKTPMATYEPRPWIKDHWR
jgi:hypothetical protein